MKTKMLRIHLRKKLTVTNGDGITEPEVADRDSNSSGNCIKEI